MVDTRFHSFAGPERAQRACWRPSAWRPTVRGRRSADRRCRGTASRRSRPHRARRAGRNIARRCAPPQAGAVIVSRASARRRARRGTVAIVADDPHRGCSSICSSSSIRRTRAAPCSALLEPHESSPLHRERCAARAGRGARSWRRDRARHASSGPTRVIGAGVTIGRNCTIGANCQRSNARIWATASCCIRARGSARRVSAGSTIGRSNRKIPQLGRVIVQDRVEIGANSHRSTAARSATR